MTYSAPFAIALLALAPTTLANDLFTDFEFVDQSGDFRIGHAPLTARFVNGEANASGDPILHHSGTHSWMVLPTQTGEVTFSVPAATVDFFFRDERPGVASVVTVFAVTGAVLAQFNGTDLVWTHVTVGATRQPVARITLENNFAGGAPFRTAIDDLRYCATPLVGTNYCGPAVPNSSGMPGAIAVRGTTTAAFNSLTLIAEHLPADQFGYFLNSHTQGFIQPAGSQGNLCLGGAIGRHSANVASSGADGVLVLVLDLTAIPTPSGPVSVLPGQTWNFQAWHRDVNPGMTSNFTDGASVSFN